MAQKEVRTTQPQNMSTMAHILCGWPLILVFIGGAIGGALGGVAYAVNVSIYKSKMPAALKFVLNPLVGIMAIGIWYVIASMIIN
jgi:tetrahydromethanopterin S-methyltransferase subunit D